ncbi:unnamed protein product [Amoebophrya sp. A120]|nr:unnamed protein product [Amoebophrya sp. A120]|eukprot:GSA120T00005042001.1
MLSFSTIEKILRDKGYEHTRTRGSHHQFTHSERATQPVPVHNHKVRVSVWWLILRNIDREDDLRCKPVQGHANDAGACDAGSGGGGEIAPRTADHAKESPTVAPRPWKPRAEPVLATDEKAEYERLLTEYERRAAEKKELLVQEMLDVEERHFAFLADNNALGAVEFLEKVLFEERKFAKFRGRPEKGADHATLMDLELYYTCALEQHAAQLPFGSEDQQKTLSKIFDFLAEMKTIWWTRTQSASLEDRHATLLNNILESLRDHLRLVRCNPRGLTLDDRTTEAFVYNQCLHEGSFRFFTFLLEYFSRDGQRRGGPRQKRFEDFAKIFRVELVALALQGGSPGKYLLLDCCGGPGRVQSKTLEEFSKYHQQAQNFRDIFALVPTEFSCWEDTMRRMTSEMGGLYRCECGGPLAGNMLPGLAPLHMSRWAFAHEHETLDWLCRLLQKTIECVEAVMNSGVFRTLSTGIADTVFKRQIFANSLGPYGSTSREGSASTKLLLSSISKCTASAKDRSSSAKQGKATATSVANVLGTVISCHMDLLHLALTHPVHDESQGTRAAGASEEIDLVQQENAWGWRVSHILYGAFAMLHAYRFSKDGRAVLEGCCGSHICPAISKKSQEIVSKKPGTGSRSKQGSRTVCKPSASRPIVDVDNHGSWRLRVFECLYFLLRQWRYDFTTRQNHVVRSFVDRTSGTIVTPGALDPETGKPPPFYEYGAYFLFYTLFVPTCLLDLHEQKDEQDDRNVDASTSFWLGTSSSEDANKFITQRGAAMWHTGSNDSDVGNDCPNLRHNIAAFLLSWQWQGLQKTTISGKELFTHIDEVLANESVERSRAVEPTSQDETMRLMATFGEGISAYRKLQSSHGKQKVCALANGKGRLSPEEVDEATASFVLAISSTGSFQFHSEENGDEDDEQEKTARMKKMLKQYEGLALPRRRRFNQALLTVFWSANMFVSEKDLEKVLPSRREACARASRASAGDAAASRVFESFHGFLHEVKRGTQVRTKIIKRMFLYVTGTMAVARTVLGGMDYRPQPYMFYSPEPALETAPVEQRRQPPSKSVLRLDFVPPPGSKSSASRVPTKPMVLWYFLTDILGIENTFENLWNAWHLVFEKNSKKTATALKTIAAKLKVEIPSLD